MEFIWKPSHISPTAPLSSFAVLGQSISVMIAANELRSMEQADLLVTVPLQKYNALDYGAAEAIIKAGYDAAASKAKVLSAFSVSEAEWQQYLADRKARQKTTPIPEFVQVAGTGPELADSIQKKLSVDVGKPVDTAKLDAQMMNSRARAASRASAIRWLKRKEPRDCRFKRSRSHTRRLWFAPSFSLTALTTITCSSALERESRFLISVAIDQSCAAMRSWVRNICR